jgi:hypothetical protein
VWRAFLARLFPAHAPGGSESALQKPKRNVPREILSGTAKPNMPLAVPKTSYLHHRLLSKRKHRLRAPRMVSTFQCPLRGRFVNPLPALGPSPKLRHLRGHAAFVQENQPFRRDRTDLFGELLASLVVRRAVAFLRVKRFFCAATPSRAALVLPGSGTPGRRWLASARATPSRSDPVAPAASSANRLSPPP